MVPVVLHHDTAGAPALTGEAGSLIAVLKWALPLLGWTLEFEDTVNNRAAFRNNPTVGSGYYLRVRDNAVDHAYVDDRVAAVEGFSIMTDVDTGSDGFPTAADSFFLKAPSADATVHEYTIIGTDTFFWWLPNFPSIAVGHKVFGAGDYLPFNPADATNFCIVGIESTSTSTSGFYSGIDQVSTRENPSGQWTRVAWDLGKFNTGQLVSPLAAPNNGVISYRVGQVGLYPDPYTGSVNTSRIHLGDEDQFQSAVGVLPGFLVPLSDIRINSQADFAHKQMWPQINNGKSIVDVLFMSLNFSLAFGDSSGRDGAGFFDILTDWDNW